MLFRSGKSTTAANLALALASEGARVGMLDADIYGPSQPTMLGLSGKPQSRDGKTMEPHLGHGLQVNSIGFLIGEDTPMIWRGPMATQALEQLIRDTRWHDLDYLVIDMPPGTGDIHLTLAQRMPVTGAVIVTTPQDIALLDARKGLKMFEKVGIPVLGIVENMAMHQCSACGKIEHIFGEGGGRRMADQYEVAYLGALPLELKIRQQSDEGCPTVVAEPNSPISDLYRGIARKLAVALAARAVSHASKFPSIVDYKIKVDDIYLDKIGTFGSTLSEQVIRYYVVYYLNELSDSFRKDSMNLKEETQFLFRMLGPDDKEIIMVNTMKK